MSTINLQGGNTLLSSGFFPPARVASTGSPLNPATGGLLTVDGVALTVGDRVLCKDETSAVNNGIYAANTGPWVRTSDASSNQQFFSGMAIVVALGTVNAKSIYICTCTDDPVVVGTSLITFAAQLPVGAGNVVGPASSTAGHVATFADGTGLLLADTAVTGTGSVVKATSPTLTTPTLGAATATTINNVAITQPAGAATLTIANSATFTVNNSLTLSATSGKTVTFNASLTLSGTDAKTLTLDNSLEFAGTDSTKFTFPGANDTVVGITAVQTLTNKTFSNTVTAAAVTTASAFGTVGNFGTLLAGTLAFTFVQGVPPASALTGTSGTIAATFTLISSSGAFTATLPAPNANNGQILWILNQVAQTVNSISANIVPAATSTAVSTLFVNTAGKWCMLIANSPSNVWQTMMAN